MFTLDAIMNQAREKVARQLCVGHLVERLAFAINFEEFEHLSGSLTEAGQTSLERDAGWGRCLRV
jgi:hypothetical protein